MQVWRRTVRRWVGDVKGKEPFLNSGLHGHPPAPYPSTSFPVPFLGSRHPQLSASQGPAKGV